MRIILTGKNSYIGKYICDSLLLEGCDAECVSVKNGIDSIDFSGVNAVVHCAAIVHKKESLYKEEYDNINYCLTKELALRAKKEGVKQFVFMSTMAVYGKEEGEINESTPLKPVTLYGKSKLKAENYLMSLNSDSFKTVIIRPPMVYGKNCPGNYARLLKIAKIMPVIPDTKNKKSLIYVENLAYFIKNIITEGKSGVYLPMDSKYVSTAEIMKLISGKPTSAFIGKLLSVLPMKIIKKAFGTLYYSEEIADRIEYISVEKAVRLSEK